MMTEEALITYYDTELVSDLVSNKNPYHKCILHFDPPQLWTPRAPSGPRWEEDRREASFVLILCLLA